MDLRISEKKFVCVDYPGIVQNQDAVLQTLGGTAEITKVIPCICGCQLSLNNSNYITSSVTGGGEGGPPRVIPSRG